MKETPIYFTRSGSFRITEPLNQITNNKMKVELIGEQAYNETKYWLKIDGSYSGIFRTYEEAKEEFDKAASFVPKLTVLEVKEVEL